MTAEIEKPKFTLYDIEAALSDLMTARAEAEEIPNMAEREQAVAAVDQALSEYVGRELQKADSIIGFCRTLKRAMDAAKEDRDYYARRAGFLERTLQRVKEYAYSAMEATGKKRLDGRSGYLLVKGNGGIEPLVVSDASMLPDNLCRMEGWIRADLLALALDMVRSSSSRGTRINDYSLTRVADGEAIRSALKEPCPVCDGIGRSKIGREVECVYCRMRKSPRGRSAPLEMANSLCGPDCRGYAEAPDPGSLWPGEQAHSGMTGPVCGSCGGTGKNAVPGAHLEPRGSHLEVK